MNIEQIKLKATPVLRNFGIKRAAVFGSISRGDATENSDIDMLVELSEPLGLLKFAKLNYTLEDALQKKVDLIKSTAIKPAFKDNILRDAIYIYG